MAKQRFKIPTMLDVSYFDMEFNLKSKNGLGVTKPVSAKTLLFGLLFAFAWFYLIFQTFIGRSGIPMVIIFTLCWLTLSVLLVKTDATGRLGASLVVSALNYVPKAGRSVPARLSDNVMPLKGVFGIDTVDPEDGRIRFLDGQVGHAYHVVGSASSLMFEEDKNRIIDKVDSFYKKLPVGVEVVYDTVYEGHRVDEQVASVKRDRKALNVNSPGLLALLSEQQDILTHAIHESVHLKSLHQYLVVRAPSDAELQELENLLYGDMEHEGLMFRLVKRLDYDETKNYLKSVTSEA